MSESFYNTLLWRVVRQRALERDGHRCTVSRLLGGVCSDGPLHVHHIVPLDDRGDPYDLENLGTVCATHHPMWEALRRRLVKLGDDMPRCRHVHRSREAREMCERRLARQRRQDAVAA